MPEKQYAYGSTDSVSEAPLVAMVVPELVEFDDETTPEGPSPSPILGDNSLVPLLPTPAPVVTRVVLATSEDVTDEASSSSSSQRVSTYSTSQVPVHPQSHRATYDGYQSTPSHRHEPHHQDSHQQDQHQDSSPRFRDIPFAILFWIQWGIMLWLGISVAPPGYQQMDLNFNFTTIENSILQQQGNYDNDNNNTHAHASKSNDDITFTKEQWDQVEEFVQQMAKYVQVYPVRILQWLILPCLGLTLWLAYVVTAVVIKPRARLAVYVSLVGWVVLTAMVMIPMAVILIVTDGGDNDDNGGNDNEHGGSVGDFFQKAMLPSIVAAVSVGAVGYYAAMAWKLVPFAGVNLKVALAGISRNCGMYFVAFLCLDVGFMWIVYWSYVVVGVSVSKNTQCQATHPELDFDGTDSSSTVCDMPGGVVLFFLVSLLWTTNVIMNTVQVTVAGVMATWCFAKDEANGCCSSAIFASLWRSLTYSFGSIALGSLVQAFVSVIRIIVESAKRQSDADEPSSCCGSLVLCILQCLARILEDVLSYYNSWAFTYVGIYGCSYLESGKRVMALFRARGWTSIVTNNLVGIVLSFTTVSISILSGFVAIIVERLVSKELSDSDSEYDSFVFGPIPGHGFWSFGVGAFIGAFVSSVMMSIVRGAINTLIVCWAESPAALDLQHPKYTKEMTDAWSTVFPDVVTPICVASSR